MLDSNTLFKEAQKTIPGGVNSPVRAFRAVGGTPVFFERAKGAYLYDVAGKGYICLLYTSPSPRDKRQSRMPSSA